MLPSQLAAQQRTEQVDPWIGVIDQRDYEDSPNGCGPTAILNALKFGGAEYQAAFNRLLGSDDSVRIRFVVDRFFRNRPSVVYPGRKRWGLHGVSTADLATGYNELLEAEGLSALNATYLDREVGEPITEMLHRVHDMIEQSLRNGACPILSLRSYAAKRRESEDFEAAWETARHHIVTVVEITKPVSETGFEIEILDPWEGKARRLYLHADATGLSFSALKGVEETGQWLSGQRFLQVLAPGVWVMRPRDLEWSDRFIVVANFLIGDF
ncbi:MAG: hypothetical protein AAF236_17315 [Verrucomicrobiota bacterium]